MLNSEFDEISNGGADLYPSEKKAEIDDVNGWIYEKLNNGVYRCGFASSQEAYDGSITDLTEAFDKVIGILSDGRKFLTGDEMTLADVRLFPTLVRFDEVYTVYFKCNTRSVVGNKFLLNYCKRIYQMEGIKDTTKMEHIKTHYYCSHPKLNFYSVIPRGVGVEKILGEPIDE